MEKQPYQVIWIKDNVIIYQSGWMLAKDAEAAKLSSIKYAEKQWDEEVRVLCRPFC